MGMTYVSAATETHHQEQSACEKREREDCIERHGNGGIASIEARPVLR